MSISMSLDEPVIFHETGQIRCDSLQTKARIQTYSLLGGMIARRQWRGGRWLRRRAIESIPADFAVVRFANDAAFRFHLKDSYWNKLLLRGFQYERPLAWLLKRLKPFEYAFMDCGANLGFWSVLVSSQAFGRKRAIAIEALRSNFELLQTNRALNGNRFECWHRAVYSEPGQAIEIFGDMDTHYGISVKADWHNSSKIGTVTTTTIDEAAGALPVPGSQIVIKLDVEGAEIEALGGAQETLSGGALLIYEDHPRDTQHRTTSHILNAGMQVRLITNKGLLPIADAAQLTQEKTRPDYEYNLVAFHHGSRFADLLGQ